MYSSIVKKILMAISGMFLMVFLVQHLAINLLSLVPDNGLMFNKISHFMGHNPVPLLTPNLPKTTFNRVQNPPPFWTKSGSF